MCATLWNEISALITAEDLINPFVGQEMKAVYVLSSKSYDMSHCIFILIWIVEMEVDGVPFDSNVLLKHKQKLIVSHRSPTFFAILTSSFLGPIKWPSADRRKNRGSSYYAFESQASFFCFVWRFVSIHVSSMWFDLMSYLHLFIELKLSTGADILKGKKGYSKKGTINSTSEVVLTALKSRHPLPGIILGK